jgi:hypothetical protein
LFNAPTNLSGRGGWWGKNLKTMPSGKKRKKSKMATHKRKKRLRKNRHKKK